MKMTKFDSQETGCGVLDMPPWGSSRRQAAGPDKGLPSALGVGTPGSWAHGGYWLPSEAMGYPGTLLRLWHGKDPT